ncbi:MAG: class I SAM-dependent methyltransferase [Acidobacteria bacterium]|nr:class I SAM-dependent methyltransferase [Acidobacteriota bacterium]
MKLEEPTGKEVWAAGHCYEPYVGRWSRLVAVEFLAWLAVPPDCDWLDVGCGTGALVQTILEHASPRSVKGVDASSAYIEHTRSHVSTTIATLEIGDAQSLGVDDESFHAAVSGLMLNFVPQPLRAVSEMERVVRPGGIVAAYVWDYAGKMELMRYFWDAAAALDPTAADLDEGRRFPICQPQALEALFRDAGLGKVDSRAIDVPTKFRNFDDYCSPFLGGQGPAPGYTVNLSEEHRSGLRERLRFALPVNADDSIDLVARAWAVRGNRIRQATPNDGLREEHRDG